MPAYAAVGERTWNVYNLCLTFVSVYQRMTDFVHMLAYAGVIRNSVTGYNVGF